ncbi:hypothetical protein N8224_01825 [Gammaproteobacteria bacterium]|nr:hypothetical protein [Gammaproteobacteria bacterium]
MSPESQHQSQKKLKIALIVDSNSSSKYVYGIAAWAKDESNLEISSLINQNIPISSANKYQRIFQIFKKKDLKYFIETLGFTFILKLELLFLARTHKYHDHFKKFNLLEKVDKLIDESGIYRVSQKQDIAQYGKASNINKIIDFSKTDYIEELIYTIEPNFFNNLKGTHHLHNNGEVTVFDFVKKSKLN